MRRAVAIARGVLGRLIESTIVLLLMASIVFFALRLVPGDPARLVLGDQASEPELAALRVRLGLDAPLYVQYTRFLEGLVRLDLGESIRHPGSPAMARVREALPDTTALAALAVALGATIGVTWALCGVAPWLGRARSFAGRLSDLVAATPLLAFAPLATYVLAAKLRIVPLPGYSESGFAGLLFASSLLAVPLAAHVARVARAALGEVARAPFMAVARSKGNSSFRVWVVHALPTCVGPIVTVVASQLGALLGGAVVLERLFERHGLGTLILEAYAARDFPVLEGAIIAGGALFVLAQAAGTLVHASIDPRVRTGEP